MGLPSVGAPSVNVLLIPVSMLRAEDLMPELLAPEPKRLAEALDDAPMDAMLVAGPDNAVYLSGAYNPVRRLILERPAVVVWPRHGQLVLVAPAVEEAFLRERSQLHDLRFYRGTTRDAVALASAALRELGLSRATIGCDLEAVSAHFYVSLRRELPDAVIVDASDVLSELRAVKTDSEVAALRRAAEATDRAEWRSLEAFELGWTEARLAARLRHALLDEGADTVTFLVLGGGIRGVAAHAAPSATALKPGEIVRFDLGGSFSGWASDVAKTAVVQEATPRQRHVYGVLRGVLNRHIERLRPGALASELYTAVAADFERAGLPFAAPHVGHGIGLSVHESPLLAPGTPRALKENMALCAELIYVEEGRERYHLEELVHVRMAGPEVISRSRRPIFDELPVIG